MDTAQPPRTGREIGVETATSPTSPTHEARHLDGGIKGDPAMTEPTTTTNVLQPTDRDNRGRFAQGWAGGPGRPPRATEVV